MYIHYLDATNPLVFHVGKTYGAYNVESRTKCFINFVGGVKKKVSHDENGCEQVWIGNKEFLLNAVDVIENIVVESPTFFIPVVAVFDNRSNKALPADHAHEMATPYKAPIVDYAEIEVMAASLGYSILNMGTSSKKPVYRLMRDGLLIASNLYGMGLCLFDVRAFLESERHANRHDIHVSSALERQLCPALGVITAVIRDIPQCGYAIAVRAYPEWFYDDDNAHEFDVDFERDRMAKMWDRDCDRAADFGLSGSNAEYKGWH